LADYAHSKGLRLGIYSDIGPLTCQKYPGSYGHYEQDAMTFATWKIDFLKLDFCNLVQDQQEHPWKYYQEMSNALNKTGLPILFNICNWGIQNPWEWASNMANSWRISKDIVPRWGTLMQILDIMTPLSYVLVVLTVQKYAGPGQWNDMDMLEVDVNYLRRGLNGNRISFSLHLMGIHANTVNFGK
jgi:alpha-galactosidase